MFKGIIYKYTSPSDKVYVGQTIDEESRKRAFYCMNKMYAGGKIDKARVKYGPENFKYEILETIALESKKELLEKLNNLEIYYISKYDSFKNGYNSTPGGQFVYIYTDLVKQKISKANSKKILQYDLYGNFLQVWDSIALAGQYLNIDSSGIGNCCRGKTKHCSVFIWKYYEEDFPLKINGLSDKKIKSIEQSKESSNITQGKTYKKVLQYDLDGKYIQTFNSLIEATNSVGGKVTTSITQACIKHTISYGYLWRYYTDNFPLQINAIIDEMQLKKTRQYRCNVYQYDLNGNIVHIWKNIAEASKTLNIGSTGICQCCNNSLKTYKNFIWKYVEHDQ